MFHRTLTVLIAIPLSVAACASDEASDTRSTAGELEFAQAPAGPGHHRGIERRLERMRTELELDDAQVELLRPILERHAEQRRAGRAQLREDLAGVLTPEQLERFDARAERHGKRGRRGRGFRRMMDELALTDAQKEQIQPIFQSLRARRQEIRDLPREERRAAMEAAHADLRAQLVPILDAEQLAKLDEFHARRQERHQRMRERRRAR